MMNNLSKAAEQLGTVRADFELLSATVTPDNKIAHHLIDRLRIASDNVAGCVILAEHDLASPLLIVGRSIVESLFVTYWATRNKENAETVLRRSCQETLRVARSQLQGTDPVAALIKKTTGQNVTNHVLEDPRIRKLDARLPVEQIAKECGLNKIYDTAYRIFSLLVHGNVENVLVNPPKVINASLEAVRCILAALHLIVGNYIREDRITGQDDILKLMFP